MGLSPFSEFGSGGSLLSTCLTDALLVENQKDSPARDSRRRADADPAAVDPARTGLPQPPPRMRCFPKSAASPPRKTIEARRRATSLDPNLSLPASAGRQREKSAEGLVET
jgi:hypothetical protein